MTINYWNLGTLAAALATLIAWLRRHRKPKLAQLGFGSNFTTQPKGTP